MKQHVIIGDEGAVTAAVIAAPHECDPDCPGDRNRHKLALFGDMVAILEKDMASVFDKGNADGLTECGDCFTLSDEPHEPDCHRALLARAREMWVAS